MKQVIVELDVYLDFSAGYPTGLVAGDSASKKVTKAIADILEAGADNLNFSYVDMDTVEDEAAAVLTHGDA